MLKLFGDMEKKSDNTKDNEIAFSPYDMRRVTCGSTTDRRKDPADEPDRVCFRVSDPRWIGVRAAVVWIVVWISSALSARSEMSL